MYDILYMQREQGMNINMLKLPMTNSKSCLPLKTTLYTNSFLYITSFRHVNITITNDSRCYGNYKITCYQTNQREYSQRYYAMANASDIIKQKSVFCLVCTCCSVDHVCYVAFWQRSNGCKQKNSGRAHLLESMQVCTGVIQ